MSIGLLSDAHGNVEAFELARAVLAGHGVSATYFLGDAVGYLPGHGVVDALVGSEIACVRGNHEAMLLEPSLRAEHDDAYRLAETAADMPPTLLEALASWPDHRRLDLPCGPVLLLHGSPADPTFGYVYPDSDLEALASRPELAGAIVCMGNTHRPFARRVGSTTFVNIGSCGLPRDVGHLGAVCVLDDERGEVRILRFDIAEATAAALRRCGPVHSRVMDVLARRAPDPFGELVAV